MKILVAVLPSKIFESRDSIWSVCSKGMILTAFWSSHAWMQDPEVTQARKRKQTTVSWGFIWRLNSTGENRSVVAIRSTYITMQTQRLTEDFEENCPIIFEIVLLVLSLQFRPLDMNIILYWICGCSFRRFKNRLFTLSFCLCIC